MKKLIAGNWKMNLDRDGVNQLCHELMTKLPVSGDPLVDFLVCPPFVYLDRCVKFFYGSCVQVGAQDCSSHDNGAYTGDISAQMLAGLGCGHVILGHSERRQGCGEASELVRQKASMAHHYGLVALICVGETESERESGKAEAIVQQQLRDSLPETARADNIVIAYEPVWAIGTGKNASSGDVEAMHGFIRGCLKEKLADFQNVRILYGGSVKPENARELLAVADVDGVLVGGASLKAESFLDIAQAAKG